MVVVDITVDSKPETLYCDNWLHERLTKKWLATIKRDDDFVCCVDGAEGTGKSVFAMQIAKILDPSFDLTKVCMNSNEFKKKIKESKRGDCVVYDEAFTGLSSKGALTEINKILVELMMEMRQLNLKVIIVLPTFFMLEKYVALFRARCLFHVYRKRGQRGFWLFFGRKKKKLLYLMGKKFLSYAEPRSERKGRFQGTYTINEAEYRKKKEGSFQNKERTGRDEKWKRQRDVLLWLLNKKLGITQDMISDFLYYFQIEADSTMMSKDLKALETKIIEEIENLPTDESITAMINSVANRNCFELLKKRQTELKEHAERELAKEKRRILKLEKLKRPNLPKEAVIRHLEIDSSSNKPENPENLPFLKINP